MKAPTKPAPDGNKINYNPRDMADNPKADSVFAELAPGVADSGNLKHKWEVPGDHTALQEPPQNLHGD